MANKFEWSAVADGVIITKMVSTDRDIVVPDSIDGRIVVELGDRFLMGSPNSDNRSITVPSTVGRFGKDAFSGIMGVNAIEYKGDVGNLFSAGMTAEYDFTLRYTMDGTEKIFGFISGFPISFPEFDAAILSTTFRMTPEVAMQRLSDPVMLTDEHREGYAKYLRSRIIPMAERAVADNDPDSLRELFSTGILAEDDMRELLKRSVRSGRTAMTSVVMSLIKSGKT
ncbi:MAG: hypothetical protein ACI381_00945 [Candidatus Methanomethylophilaceae archaeon]